MVERSGGRVKQDSSDSEEEVKETITDDSNT